MAERNRPQNLPSPPSAPAPPRQSAIADCVAALERDREALLVENQRLTSSHLSLREELSSAHQDLRLVAAIAQEIKAESDSKIMEVLERSVQTEARLRSVNAAKEEFAVVKEVVEKLKANGEDLSAQLGVVNRDFEKMKGELGATDLPKIRDEIKYFAREIEKLRAALETEKKNRAINLKHSQAKEKKKALLVEEIDSLRNKLITLAKEKRERAAKEEIDRMKDALTLAKKERERKAAAVAPKLCMNSVGLLYGGRSYPVKNSQMCLREVKVEESKEANGVSRKDSEDDERKVKPHWTVPAVQSVVRTQGRQYQCFNCGDSSHSKKSCDKPIKTCLHCGKAGHIIKYCMKLQRDTKKKNGKQISAVPVGKRKRNQNARAGTQRKWAPQEPNTPPPSYIVSTLR